jgi:Holliday junction resolvase
MTRARAELGRSNAAAGKGWEVALGKALAELQQARRLGWVHVPQPAFRQIAAGRYVRAARALTDFLAVINPGGRCLAIEAKSTDQGRLYRAEVKDHQAVVLGETAAAGGVALLAVEFRGAGGFLVPWRAVPWSRLRSSESVDAAALAPWRAGVLLDALERLIGDVRPARSPSVATGQQENT